MTFTRIGDAIRAGERVTILMRHAERPPLEPGDTTFGATLSITPYGRETARRFGLLLAQAAIVPEQVRAYASSTVRTIQTAECILRGLRDDGRHDDGSVALVPVLGSESPFFGALDERMALIAEGRYRDRLNDYFRTGEQRGYRPLAPATDQMEAALLELEAPLPGLVIAVTHDINVASFLAGKGVVTSFDEETWPHYLDAVIMTRHADGSVAYASMRWNEPSEQVHLDR